MVLSSAALSRALQGKMVLAPLTKGGNLPFRRLCADFGMEASVGEMVYARQLADGSRVEAARLRRAANEACFGVQIAANDVDDGARAAAMAAAAGADFLDLNCGCPIYEATRRGLGSAMLRQPSRLARLVEGLAAASPLPLTVKIRIGTTADTVNVRKVAQKLRDAGAAAVTIHGRTAEQRYTKSADWRLVGRVVADGAAAGSAVPIIGNGDILTHYEARRHMASSGVHAVMVGRGALIKPWIFDEFRTGSGWEPDAAERVAVYRRLACYMKEHFGDDERGWRSASLFLPWHFDFLSRYQHLPEAEFGAASELQPLLQTRVQPADGRPPLEVLLGHASAETHALIAAQLWQAESDADAVGRLTALARSSELARIDEGAPREPGSAEELANVSDGAGAGAARRGTTRRVRSVAPKRSEDEIARIRAERAAKRALTGAPAHVDGARDGWADRGVAA